MTNCECIQYASYAALAFLGLKVFLNLASLFYRRLVARPLDVTKFGEWAVVTGSTDGIGKAYAFALAKKGLNIILVSRSPFKLQNVAAEIESTYKVKVKIVDLDFTSDEDAIRKRITEAVKDFDIGVLVNNVGMSYEYPEAFLDIVGGYEAIQKIIQVNINSLNAVTHSVLPGMVEKKRGVVINISSLSAHVPSPLLSVYAGSKSYVTKFSEGLAVEYKSKGIVVQCVVPGYVVSNMSKIRKANIIAPTPKAFVASALSRLGIDSVTNGYWSHDLMQWAVEMVPEGLATKLSYNQINDIRKRAIRRKEKEAKAN